MLARKMTPVASSATDIIMVCFQIPARLSGSVTGAESRRPGGKGTIAIFINYDLMKYKLAPGAA